MYHQVDRLRRDMRNNGRIYEDVAKILKERYILRSRSMLGVVLHGVAYFCA